MYKSRWPLFDDQMIENVTQILKSGKVNQWTGQKVYDFEKKFSEYFGMQHFLQNRQKIYMNFYIFLMAKGYEQA